MTLQERAFRAVVDYGWGPTQNTATSIGGPGSLAVLHESAEAWLRQNYSELELFSLLTVQS